MIRLLLASIIYVITAFESVSAMTTQRIVIRGYNALTMFDVLDKSGLQKITFENLAMIAASKVECYLPVIPDPEAKCTILSLADEQFYLEIQNGSGSLYEVLVAAGAGFDDGSVGAIKAGLKNVLCIESLEEHSETYCEGDAFLTP